VRFNPEAADEVAAFQFHPSQTLTREPDGFTTVCFRAGGLRELAWHLFTWGDAVQIIQPILLKTVMSDLLAESSRPFLTADLTKRATRSAAGQDCGDD
jgi:predicted DNA-binding transcriptional regulator YafY